MTARKDKFEFAPDDSSDIPLWVQLKHRMVYLIESGFYSPGDRLPTVRGLASEISVNYNTVNKVYMSLAADGYIESVRGRGAFVMELADSGDDMRSHEADDLVREFINACLDLGLSYDDIQACVARRINKLKFRDKKSSEQNVVDMSAARKRKSGGAGA